LLKFEAPLKILQENIALKSLGLLGIVVDSYDILGGLPITLRVFFLEAKPAFLKI